MLVFTHSFLDLLKLAFRYLLGLDGPDSDGKLVNGLANPTLLPQTEEDKFKEVVGKPLEEVFNYPQNSGNENSNKSEIPDDKKWERCIVAKIMNQKLFAAFIHGLHPGFRISNFITTDQANEIAENIREYIEEYKTAPGVGKAGVTLVDHGKKFDEYLEFSSIWLAMEIPERDHLVNEVCGYLTTNTGYPFIPLKSVDNSCYYGAFRQINKGAGPHLDNVTVDSNAFSNRKINFQGSLVLHLKVPKDGGETVIWNRRAKEGDKKYLVDEWQYKIDMFKGIDSVEVPCVAGELVILSTLNYHMVKPCLEAGAERISFSMFIVQFEDDLNRLYIYN